jgi:hypothetical protein
MAKLIYHIAAQSIISGTSKGEKRGNFGYAGAAIWLVLYLSNNSLISLY